MLLNTLIIFFKSSRMIFLKPEARFYPAFIFFFILIGLPTIGVADIANAFIGGMVELQVRESGKYVTGAGNEVEVLSSSENGINNDFSRWVIEEVPGKSETYNLRHPVTGKYLTVTAPSGLDEAYLVLATRYESEIITPLQEFTFVKQVSGSNRYKIRTSYKNNAGTRYYVLAFPDGTYTNGVSLEVQLNVQVGNDEHQQFDFSFVGDQSSRSNFESGNLAIVMNDVYLAAWHLRSNADKILWHIDGDGYLSQQLSTGLVDYSNNGIFIFIKDPDRDNRFRIQHKESKK